LGVPTPLRYRLHLDPDPAAGTFAGELTLDLALAGPADEIALDCLDLEISGAWIDGRLADWRIDGARLVVTPDRPLSAAASLRIAYAGRLSDSPRGLYLSEGFVAAQLQPDHARRVFPCFDDPALRAVFELSVTVPEGQVAISNAAAVSDADGATTFAPTPPLPTHLMTVAVGAFQSVSDGAVSLHSLTPNANDAWVLRTAAATAAFYGVWLGHPYAFGKLDLVLLPQTGAAGMENTGAIFLRQAALTRPTREAATLVAHEIAHQWFGGLVTPAGWEELWLNEGFATFLAPKAVAAIAPELFDEAAETRQIREALHVDWAPTGRPLRQPAPTSGQIAELFDVIAYRKGAGLLRMLEGWLGEAAFRQGLRLYLERHALGVAASADLWAALEAASGEPVARVAGPFADQAGAPAVRLDWRDETLDITREDGGAGPLPLRLRIGLRDGRVVTREQILDDAARLVLDAPVAWAFANPGAATYARALPTPTRPPLDTLTDAEATVVLEDSWLSLWIGETDLLACLALIGDAGVAGLALGSARNHLREIGDLLAGGARRAAFDRWRAGFANLAAPPEPDVEALLADVSAGGEEESLILDLCALRDPAARPRQLALLAEPTLSEASAQLACETLLGNSAAAQETWTWLKAHWDAAGNRLVGWGGRGAIAGLAAFSDPAMSRDIAAFFAGRIPPGAERTLEASLARIAGRAHFRQRWQTSMDCLLMQAATGAPPATAGQLANRRRLGLLAAGFDGALLQRRLLDQQGQAPPPWMHTADNLQAALAAVERQMIQAWGGGTPAAGNLVQSLVDDLTAAADQLERLGRKLADGDTATWRQAVAAFARGRATRDRLGDEAILLAALSGDRDGADRLRAGVLVRPADAELDLFATTPNRRQRLALKAAAADIPAALRDLAAELASVPTP
jgi:hypothetical protein